MYNFSELITSHVVIQKFKTKHPCKANFSVAVQVCRQFLLGNVSPPDVEATSGVFCPIVFGVFWKKATKQGAIAGLLAGGLFMMYALLTGFSVAGIGGELLSGIVSAIVLVVVSLATQPKKTAA